MPRQHVLTRQPPPWKATGLTRYLPIRSVRVSSNALAAAFTAARALCLCLFCAALLPTLALPQNSSGVSVEKSPQLFTVMAALYAAGYQAEGSADAGPDFVALEERLRALQGPAVDDLRAYYHDHQLGSGGETASRYISFALLVGPPPKLLFQEDEGMLPSDVLAIGDFGKVLQKFGEEAHLDREWQHMAAAYDQQVLRYQGPVLRTAFLTSGYLREVRKSTSRSAFTVYVEPLAGTRTNFRTTADHYSIVVGSARELPMDEIRHAYIHFLIDPLVVQYVAEIDKKSDLLAIATKAPQFPREYQQDFIGLFDECMVKAVELRLNRMSAAALENALRENDQRGLVLVRPLVDQLKLFEKDSPSMQYYFPDLVRAINVDTEKARLTKITFTATAPSTPAQVADNAASAPSASTSDQPAAQPVTPPSDATSHPPSISSPGHRQYPSSATDTTADSAPVTDLDRNLLAAQQQLAAGHPEAAQAMFETILATHPGEPRAQFELAMIAVKQKDGDRAEHLLRVIVRHSPTGDGIQPDPKTLAWSHVYLGRIYDLQQNRDDAVAEYSAALNVPGAPDQARKAAEAGQKVPYGSDALPSPAPAQNEQH